MKLLNKKDVPIRLTIGEQHALELAAKGWLGSGDGVKLATAANLSKKGLITLSGSIYEHETHGLFGRGNLRRRKIFCWTAEITEAGRGVLARLRER